MKKKIALLDLLALFILIVVSLNFILNLVDKRHKILNRLTDKFTPSATDVINTRIAEINQKVNEAISKLNVLEKNSLEIKEKTETEVQNILKENEKTPKLTDTNVSDQLNKNTIPPLDLRSAGYVAYDLNEEDEFWAKEISNGGYILYFRHAEREKWPIVMSYDAFELYTNEKEAENSSYSKAVCLSDRGIEQAKIMNFYIKLSKMKISEVISSPSCRAKQTSELAFGRIDKISNALVHYGPWNEERKDHLDAVKKIFKDVKIKDNQNVIISAHNGVIQRYLFDKIDIDITDFNIGEAGFYIISKDEKNNIILKKQVYNFRNFSKYLITRDYEMYSTN